MKARRRNLAVITCLAVALFGTGAAAARDTALHNVDQELRWNGVADGTVSIVTDSCHRACDEFAFEIALPAGTWRRDGGVQVAIRWEDEGDDLELTVYDAADTEVARSHGTASTAESVILPGVANGRYRAVVSVRPEQLVEGRFQPDVTKERVEYEGLVEVEWNPRPYPTRDLLPNLTSLPVRNVTISMGAYLFDPGISPASCYPEETAEFGARRCLRFDQIIANTGEGPMELRFRMEGFATEQPIVQRIYSSHGGYRDRIADTYTFHPTHAHFHYENFAQARLWVSNAAGERLGDQAVKTGEKAGFCPIDIENITFERPGDAPRSYFFEGCNDPTESDASGTYIVTGISPGWADVYNWFLADQYIEISGVPDGYYLLESISDPAETVVETVETDNSTQALIRICGAWVDIVGDGTFAICPA